MDHRRQQILVFFVGLCAAVLLLEIGLRAAASVYQKGKKSPKNDFIATPDNQYSILCLGNSFTLGVGAAAGEGYPEQLQRLLREGIKGKNITVINGGIGNENTADLLYKLEATIKYANPDLIILQTGQPNWWNYYKYSTYLKRTSQETAYLKRIIFFLNDYFCKSSTYKLFTILYSNIKDKISFRRSKRDVPIQNEYSEAEERIMFNAAFPGENIGREFFNDKQKVEEAIRRFKKGIETAPDDPKNYILIGQIYFFQSNYEEALQWFMKAIRVSPEYGNNGEVNRSYVYIRQIRGLYKDGRNGKIRETIDRFVHDFEKSNPGSSENLLPLTNEQIIEWTESDIKEIIKIIRQKKIKIILQSYPYPLEVRKIPIDAILRKIANELHISFVDNELLFREMLERGSRSEDFFVADGHCNARGYGIVAMNVYNKIMEEGMLESGQ